MRYLDLRASWLGGSGHILDAQCNARLPSASMAARRAAWLTASAVPGWWALTAAAGEGWVLEAQLWLAPLELEVLTAPCASVAAAGGRDAPNEHQIDRSVCEGGQTSFPVNPHSFYVHHGQQIFKAAVVYDAQAIRKQILSLRQRVRRDWCIQSGAAATGTPLGRGP